MKIVFFGTPHFAAQILGFLIDHGVDHEIQVAAVVSKPDKPKGRSGTPVSTPVKSVAQEKIPQVPLYQPEVASAPEFADTLRGCQADLFVVVAYGEIVRQHLLDMPRLGCINVHPSLLPKYRGAAPIQRSLINGEKKTGVTIMHLVRKMDAGEIIKVSEVDVGPDMTAGELEQELCRLGSQALLEVIRDLGKGIDVRIPQDDSQATLAPKIELEDCQIDWGWPAERIHNLVRGVNPEPGAWCYAWVRGEKKRLRILRTQLVAEASQAIPSAAPQAMPGAIVAMDKQGPLIACGQQALRLVELQLEGKKVMAAADLWRGYPSGTLTLTQG
jgi:methionyl-tRNA formyltransferase